MISRITRIGGMAAAFIIIAGVSAYLTLTFMIKQRNTVIVPDLVGKDVVDVLFLLTDLGLNTKVRGAEYRTDIPVNHSKVRRVSAKFFRTHRWRRGSQKQCERTEDDADPTSPEF